MDRLERLLTGASVNLYAGTMDRRGALGALGRAAAGLAAAGMALAAAAPANAASGPQLRPAPAVPVLLPPGEKAVLPLGCNSCSGTAEWVCSNCCVDGTCCPGRNLYRQPCFDQNCNLYYVCWCA